MRNRLLGFWRGVGSARAWGQLLASLLIVGCSTEKLPPSPASDATEGDTFADDEDATAPMTTAQPAEPGDAGTAEVCEVAYVVNEGEAEAFERLSATVVDEKGAPVADTIVQACGLNVCLQGNTTDQGRALIAGDETIEKLAFKYGDGLHYAQIALPLSGQTTYDLGEQRTVAFPAPEPNNRFVGGETLTSSDVALTLADDAQTVIDVLSYADPSEHLFVAKAFESDGFPEAARDRGFVSLWALGPAKTEFCPPSKLSLPNLTELSPGTRVDLLLHITDVSGRHGRYAEWQVVAAGTVDGAGGRIVTDDGRGIPELGLIGVRPQK